MKPRFLKTRLHQSDYQAIAEAADAEGVTISEFTRNSLMANRQAMTTEGALQQILDRLPAPSNSASSGQIADVAIFETLYLLRELALVQVPQSLARVNAKLDRQFGVGREKL